MIKIYFCPKCHRKIEPPKWLFNANIKTEKGITIQCGYKDRKGQCSGKVKFKPDAHTNIRHTEQESTEA
jgi:hypothetical protein